MTPSRNIQSLFKYSYALFDRVWYSINLLTDDQFAQEIDYSHGSLRNQIVHVAMAESRWLMALHEHPDARGYSLDPMDFPDRASAQTLWDSTTQDVTNYIAVLNQYPRQLRGNRAG